MSLKEMRKKKYMQSSIALLLGVSPKTIVFAESGKSCSLDLALRYSKLIGYEIDPTGRVALAFRDLHHVAVTSVIHACREFAIPFDPQKLFEVQK